MGLKQGINGEPFRSGDAGGASVPTGENKLQDQMVIVRYLNLVMIVRILNVVKMLRLDDLVILMRL